MLTGPPPQSLGQVGLRLLGALVSFAIFAAYWAPTTAAIVRRHTRLGLVIFLNLFAFLAFPYFAAWVQVLAEPSHRPRKPKAAVPADPAVVPFQRRPNGGAA